MTNNFLLITHNKLKKIKNFVDKNVDTDDIPVGYQSMTRNNNMDIIIKKRGKSLNGMSQTKQLIKAVEHHITNPVESSAQTFLTQQVHLRI